MKLTDPHEVIHAYAAKAAQHVYDTWRHSPRKHKDFCQIGVAVDGDVPGEFGVVQVRIAWAELETMSVEKLTELFCSAIRAVAAAEAEAAAGPKPRETLH